ncbi:MAG: NAD(P)/FAD-dependent oxidoreductase [Acidobacteriota bacterium]
MSEKHALIVGAGLAGLSCAVHLHRSGFGVKVLEASDGIGGRVRTDRVEGFLLDRGFQVLLTAYPECQRMLDYRALDLKPFFPGALVRLNGRFHRVADPWLRPLAGVAGAFSPVGSLTDKLRVARLRRRLLATPLDEVFRRPEKTTAQALADEGFSDAMVERFFRPFLGGIFLESKLETSSRMFEFVFKMFSSGDTALPSRGMQQIPEQLASQLPEGTVETGRRVVELDGRTLRLADGETLTAPIVVLASDAAAAAELLPEVSNPAWCATTSLYFAAPKAPIELPILVLNGDGSGPINNLCIPSRVSPHYAPAGQELVCVSVVDDARQGDELEQAVRGQLRTYFGDQIDAWRHLRSDVISHALPAQAPPALEPAERPVQVRPGLYLCGDYRDNASINGAMVSGRRAAEAIVGSA